MMVWPPFRDEETGKTPECCEAGLEGGHPDCLPISIPHSDPFFSLHGRSCMNFARVVPGLKQGCGLGPREQFNTISSVIDANTVYSSDPALQRKLRSPLPVLSTITIYMYIIELQTKVHPKIRNHGEGPY